MGGNGPVAPCIKKGTTHRKGKTNEQEMKGEEIVTGGMYVRGKLSDWFVQENDTYDFIWCYDIERKLKLRWKNSGCHRPRKS